MNKPNEEPWPDQPLHSASRFDEPSEARPYPETKSKRPHVIVVGGGVAGMTTAHRLLERGHDVTMLEANAYLGGKLGTHQEEAGQQKKRENYGFKQCQECKGKGCANARGEAKRKTDWHEHCYHMYLNWYHNFWQLMREVGAIKNFSPMDHLTTIYPKPKNQPIQAMNPGSTSTLWQNMTCGLGTPWDVFLHSQATLDLLAMPVTADRRLDQISVEAFMRSRPYTTAGSREASNEILAKAFAAPTAITSASSYKSYLKYGARLPEPVMWVLNDHTWNGIFKPWLEYFGELAGDYTIECSDLSEMPVLDELQRKMDERKFTDDEKEKRPSFTLMPLLELVGMEVEDSGDFLMRVKPNTGSPSQDQVPIDMDDRPWRFDGQVVLTLPPRQLSQLIFTRADNNDARAKAHYAPFERILASRAPKLMDVTRLNGAPIMVLDVVFKKPLDPPLPKGPILLRGSKYEMSLYDNTQMWLSHSITPKMTTQLSICASDADFLMPFADQQKEEEREAEVMRPQKKEGGAHNIVRMMLEELARYIDFDPEEDILHCRTHLQTNARGELFINAVDTWHNRPKTTTEVPDLFVAGDFVQTPIDVVTIEGAAMSGLMAAEAVRRRTEQGSAVPIEVPDTIPGASMKLAAQSMRPLAYGAKAVSEGSSTISRAFNQMFPKS